ncbi:zinc transporter ZntB [Halanaerobium sp. MA284_MarDTE_T2]|uniref:zinc transporter ZntB n=1 Tax=Halanaerobium sp. MA284_MarDTE_T2 TaxID=2183913 RepID=UPI000DF4AAB9|nr:zinc transporter ZntB [Halanaerobium sp. MA284_MarDTE_T2]RCW47741.1 zinc transporter [Halanaerobium sp. MA284_MarDTE_T2]
MNNTNEALLNGYIITEEKIEKIKDLNLNNITERDSLGEKGFLWYHLNVGTEETRTWLKNKSGLSEIVIQELISEETRPRILKDDDGILINLRGLNFNADSDEEDMVSLHMWIEPGRIITSRSERVLTMDEIDKSYDAGAGPLSINDFLIRVIDGITNKISEYIYDMEEQIDDMEEEVLTGETDRLRSQLSEKRRKTIIIRRYIVPQRELMARLYREKIPWLTEANKEYIYEFSDRTIRLLEELDNIRDRAALIHEEINNRINDQMNRTMYILSIVGSIFLPLGFLTGLFGINIGGMPGVDNDSAFWIFSFSMVILIVIEYILFKKNNWL